MYFYTGFILLLALSVQLQCQSTNEVNKDEHMQIINQYKIPTVSIPEAFVELNYLYLNFDPGDSYDSPSGMILYPDGNILRYSDKEVVRSSEGVNIQTGPLKWRKETRIKKQGVEKIMELLDSFESDEMSQIPEYSIIVEYRQNRQLHRIAAEGAQTPKNYKLFTEINNLISSHIIPLR